MGVVIIIRSLNIHSSVETIIMRNQQLSFIISKGLRSLYVSNKGK
jgi:hypothetical protein